MFHRRSGSPQFIADASHLEMGFRVHGRDLEDPTQDLLGFPETAPAIGTTVART